MVWNRLEDLVDVILQKKTSFEKEHESLNTKNNNNNNNNDRIVSQHLIQDRESLREIVSSTLDSLNIDASADHEATRRTVQESTDKILTAISQNINNNNNVLLRSKRGSNNNNSRNGERRKPQQEHEYGKVSINTVCPGKNGTTRVTIVDRGCSAHLINLSLLKTFRFFFGHTV